MTVYFIRVGEEGPVKIGHAADVTARLGSLQVGHHERLYLLRALDGGAEIESWFHKQFAADHIRGEWYNYRPEMEEIEPPDLAAMAPSAISELIDAFGGPTEFAKVIDKIPSTASEMKRSGSIRVSYWPKIIAAAAERRIKGVNSESLMLMHLGEDVSA